MWNFNGNLFWKRFVRSLKVKYLLISALAYTQIFHILFLTLCMYFNAALYWKAATDHFHLTSVINISIVCWRTPKISVNWISGGLKFPGRMCSTVKISETSVSAVNSHACIFLPLHLETIILMHHPQHSHLLSPGVNTGWLAEANTAVRNWSALTKLLAPDNNYSWRVFALVKTTNFWGLQTHRCNMLQILSDIIRLQRKRHYMFLLMMDFNGPKLKIETFQINHLWPKLYFFDDLIIINGSI